MILIRKKFHEAKLNYLEDISKQNDDHSKHLDGNLIGLSAIIDDDSSTYSSLNKTR